MRGSGLHPGSLHPTASATVPTQEVEGTEGWGALWNSPGTLNEVQGHRPHTGGPWLWIPCAFPHWFQNIFVVICLFKSRSFNEKSYGFCHHVPHSKASCDMKWIMDTLLLAWYGGGIWSEEVGHWKPDLDGCISYLAPTCVLCFLATMR